VRFVSDPVDYCLEEDRRLLYVRWRDGHESRYPLDDLRKVCPCVDCRTAERPQPQGGAPGPDRPGDRPGGDPDRADGARGPICVEFHLE